VLVGLVNPHQYTQAFSYRLNAPITLAYLARRLADYDIECEAIDLGGLGKNESFILDGLEEFDAIGITALSNQAEGARRLLKLIRHHYPDMYVVCGGVDVTLFPEKYLQWGATCAVVGQADGNVHEIFTQRPRGVVKGKPGPIHGRPLWEHHRPLPWQYPGHPDPIAWPEALCMATRGCPYKCSFCGNIIWNGQRTRRREVDDVVEELHWLKDHGVKAVFFYDDEIVSAPTLSYLLDIISKVDGLVYRAQGRCDIEHKQVSLLYELARHGLKRVMWGVESFSDKVLAAANKQLTCEQIMETLKLSHQAGIENFAFIMAGMPEETPEAASATFSTLKTVLTVKLVQKVQVTPCTPMPGTALYKQAEAEGWLFEGDPFQYSVTGGTPWMSQAEIAEYVQGLRRLARSHGAL